MMSIINEFEARRTDKMIFTTKEFEIYEDELQDFRQYGYKVAKVSLNQFEITRL